MARETTKTQSEVLGVLTRRLKPMSAYEILNELRWRNAKLAPTTIYRALSALGEKGLVHRIESANAFISCKRRCRGGEAILSICAECGAVDEHAASDVLRELSAITETAGFSPSRHVIEVHGRCAACGPEKAKHP